MFSTLSVFVNPGQTEFTVIPYAASWLDKDLAKPKTPALAVFERIRLSIGCLADTEVIFIILPHFWLFILSITLYERLMVLVRFSSIAFR